MFLFLRYVSEILRKSLIYSMNSTKPLYKYLAQKKGEVADLVTMAKILHKMNLDFKKHLPLPLQKQVSLSRLSNTTLVVVANSPAWAAKLRFLSTSLLTTLQKNSHYFQTVTKIEVIAQPVLEEPNKKLPVYKRQLSQQSSELLLSTAEFIEDGELSAALRRLASRRRAEPK